MTKRLIFVALLPLLACESRDVKPKSTSEPQLPTEVKASFEREYPGIDNPTWEKEGEDFEAVFMVNNREASAVFHPDGKLAETETEIDLTLLPEAAVNYVREYAAGAKIDEASKIVNPDGTVNYEAEVDGKDLIFDADGSFLREL